MEASASTQLVSWSSDHEGGDQGHVPELPSHDQRAEIRLLHLRLVGEEPVRGASARCGGASVCQQLLPRLLGTHAVFPGQRRRRFLEHQGHEQRVVGDVCGRCQFY
ncbi:hypothetical protein NDU88_006528 [Pleurodeles waltl]|uniref:Uncharacterized protein n=1 Tax=Pleurodeles waltl TaxID=8319 RepID=A0AAV7SQ52_PLEWA|nr:hypothetical protein NDU88_006528 [Pleurodeles waltl]